MILNISLEFSCKFYWARNTLGWLDLPPHLEYLNLESSTHRTPSSFPHFPTLRSSFETVSVFVSYLECTEWLWDKCECWTSREVGSLETGFWPVFSVVNICTQALKHWYVVICIALRAAVVWRQIWSLKATNCAQLQKQYSFSILTPLSVPKTCSQHRRRCLLWHQIIHLTNTVFLLAKIEK